MLDILEIIKNVESIYNTNTNLSVLKDIERVLDELDLYVYENWEDGELCSGPHMNRHWVRVSFMWPQDKMPNPLGGKRLLDYGCRVKYEKTFLLEPRTVKTPEDLRPGTKKGKLDRKPIWVVELEMPRKLVSDIYNGYMVKMKEQMGIGKEKQAQGAPAESVDKLQAGAAPQPAGVPGAMPAAGAAMPAAGAAMPGGLGNV